MVAANLQSEYDKHTQEIKIVDKEVEWISTKEAAEIMEVTVTTVSRLCREKKLSCQQFGEGRRSVWMVEKESAETYKKTVGGRGNELPKANENNL